MGYEEISKDSYTRIVEQQELYTQHLKQQVKNDRESCDRSERTMVTEYSNYGLAKNIFSGCSNEKTTLENNIKKLEEEKQLRIKKETEKAQKEGKSEDEIAKIVYNIENEYAGRLNTMKFNLTRVGTSVTIKENTMSEAETKYRGSRFSNIAATCNYLGSLHSLFSAELDLSKMQQHQSFLNSKKNSLWT